MYMGFFDRFKNQEEKIKKFEVNINSLEKWFQEKFSSEIENSKKDSDKIKAETIRLLKETRIHLDKLEKASFEKNDKMFSAVNMLKDSFVKSSKLSLYKLEKDTSLTTIKSVIAEVNNISPKQAISLSNYFKAYMADIINNVKKASDNLKKLDDYKILIVQEKLMKFLEIKKEKTNDNEKIIISKIDVKSRIEELKKDIESLIEDKEILSQSEESRKLKNEKISLVNKKNKIEKLELLIKEKLSPLKRPLKKLEHQAKDKLIEDLIHSPFKTFLNNDINPVISKLKENLYNLNLKENEMKKLEEFFSVDLSQYKLKYINLKQNIEKIKELISESKLEEKIKSIENLIKRKENQIKELEKEIVSLNKRYEENKKILEENKKDFENYILNKLNIELKIL